jgi:FixJ family two-component response regulator
MCEEFVAAGRIGALNKREQQVPNALGRGRSSRMIAFELGISALTVELHRIETSSNV